MCTEHLLFKAITLPAVIGPTHSPYFLFFPYQKFSVYSICKVHAQVSPHSLNIFFLKQNSHNIGLKCNMTWYLKYSQGFTSITSI